MSHQVESMAFAHEVPWHGLGARVAPNATPDEMLVAAGLDWTVERRALYYRDASNTQCAVPGKKALVRSSDGKVMTIASNAWKPLQNSEMLRFFQDYSAAGGASLETAGSLRGGSIVWGLANLHDGFSAGGNDHVKGYMLFISPHKVGASITIRDTSVRVVCANTMAMALGEDAAIHWSQNHLTEFDHEGAKAHVERAHENLARAARRAETMKRLKLSVADQLQVLAPFFGGEGLDADVLADPNTAPVKLQQVMYSVQKGPGAEPETAWGTLQGVLHWADHVNGRGAATRMFRSWVGDVSKTKAAVERKLFELAQ